MGTNFYARHIPTEKEYAKMQKALADKQLDKLKDLLVDATVEHHIGKRSWGWAFSFQARPNPNEYNPDNEADVPWEDNLESLKKYLKRKDVQIVNEYGETFTPEQFWKEEVGESLTVHEPNADGRHFYSHETYHRDHPEEHYHHDSSEKVKNNIRWIYCWFG